MNDRIIELSGIHWDEMKEWVVLDENYREIVFSAHVKGPDGFQECYRYIQSLCPNGKCEN